MCKYRNTAAVFAPFWRGLRMNWGWRETYFILSGYLCQTIGIPNTELQKYSSCLCALQVRFKSYNGGWRETDSWDVWTTQYISFNPDFRAKHWGGGGTNSRICVKPKIFSSTLIFVPSIWGVETYFWEMFIREGFTKKSFKKSGDSPNGGGSPRTKLTFRDHIGPF